ncbi:hypothetical protein BH23CHL2_BH23CHL2_16670 [soil metagenome]
MSILPIACSLSEEDLKEVAAHYSQAAGHYQAVVHYESDHARISLRGEKPMLRAFLDDMVTREQGCCSHLQFDVSERADGYNVELGVSGESGENPDAALRQTVPILFPVADAV